MESNIKLSTHSASVTQRDRAEEDFVHLTVKQQLHVGYSLLALSDKAEMAPTNFLVLHVLLVTMPLAGNAARSHTVKLKTRPLDGAALCALDPPTLSTGMSAKVPHVPGSVRCTMTCTEDAECIHVNYISTESNPCQLYHYRPTNFDVRENCQHFYQPGNKTWFIFCRFTSSHVDFLL